MQTTAFFGVNKGDSLEPYKKGHLPAITDPQALVPLLRAIDAYKGTHVVKCALMPVP